MSDKTKEIQKELDRINKEIENVSSGNVEFTDDELLYVLKSEREDLLMEKRKILTNRRKFATELQKESIEAMNAFNDFHKKVKTWKKLNVELCEKLSLGQISSKEYHEEIRKAKAEMTVSLRALCCKHLFSWV